MAWLELDPDLSHSPVLVDHGVGVDVIFQRDSEITAQMEALGVRSTAETFGDRPMPTTEARVEAEHRVAPQIGPFATYAA